MSKKDKINENEEVVKDTVEEAVETANEQEEKELTVEEKLTKELEEQKDKYMRLYAEYDNYRKRTQSEKAAIYSDATAKAVEEILPIADSITMAMSTMADKDVPQEFTKGIELIAKGLKASFDKMNITPFGEVGESFDPNMHNAISMIEDESLGENTIAQVYQIGYKLNDKIIRHAMVVVANCG